MESTINDHLKFGEPTNMASTTSRTWTARLWQCLAGANRSPKPAPTRPSIVLEQLENRLTPSTTPTVDLAAHGAVGAINDAIFRQFDAQPTGTGVINSFVRLQAPNAKATVQQGYNTDYRKLQFDENTSPQFTRSLQLRDVPVVNFNGVRYREFLLDINQKASQPYLSLDELRLFAGDAPNLHGYDPVTRQLAGRFDPVYDLDAGADNWIRLDARLNQGSGKGDMLAYIPDAAFASAGADAYVYLYSKFGVNATGNAGFEEWAAGQSALTESGGSISGTVTDVTTGLPVANLTIFLDANNNGVLDENEEYVTTDETGYYIFTGLSTGLGDLSTYTVRVVPGEFTDLMGALVAALETDGQNVILNFYLESTGGGTDPGT